MDDPLILLHSALGQPGSGRTRYGAAMELHRRGLLSDAQLEVYRIASAHDGRDALVMLSERHLPLPPPASQSGQIAIADLVAQIITYMGELSGDGCVEARQGVARWSGPVTLPEARPSDVVDRHLTGALAALSGTHPALATAIARAAPLLRWGPYDRYPPAEIGEEFATGHTFASIIGEDAPMAAQDFDLGLFLIAPNVLYRDHCHRAPELYAPLTGPHGWRFGPDRPLVVKPAHDPVWNPPYRPHLTKVGPTPFLCIFCWTADVNEVATVLPANDWPELQALRL